MLGADLPLIDDAVTIEHLLSHRSGIGDYLDEEAMGDITDYVMPVPVHELATTEQYLAVLGGHPTVFPPGERFAYCNGGYIVLALIAERASGVPFHDLVRQRVCRPAGMSHTEFLRSDELPGDAAVGYLSNDSPRTNVLHLPVVGGGDGGIYSTAADLRTFWEALFDGRIVPERWVAEMVRPRSDVPAEGKRYGLGFWLHASSAVVMMEGYDAGVSFRSMYDPVSARQRDRHRQHLRGAWPYYELLEERWRARSRPAGGQPVISARSVKVTAATTSEPTSQTVMRTRARSGDSAVGIGRRAEAPPLPPTAAVARLNGRYFTMSGRKIWAKTPPK